MSSMGISLYCYRCEQSQLQHEASTDSEKYPRTPYSAKLKSILFISNMWAERLLCSQILEYHIFGILGDEILGDEILGDEILGDEYFLDMRDLQLARSKLFEAPYSHPLKPPIAPPAPFELRRIPYGAFRDAVFADMIGVENGFICSLLKFRYKKTPSIQDIQLKDITVMIWHYQTNRHLKVAAAWPKTPPEQFNMIGRIIQDLGHAVMLGF